MTGSTHAPHVSLLGTLGRLYAALAGTAGVLAVFTGASGAARVCALFLLGTTSMYFGRVAFVDAVRLLTTRRAHSLGADVRVALASLGTSFRVTRVMNEGLEREDHVVVGPTGVFVIVAADGDRHAGASHRRLFPDSRAWWRDMIEDCHIEALRAGERLRRHAGHPATVHPVLCLRSGLVTVGRVVRGVRVVHIGELARAIGDQPATTKLDARQIERVSAALAAVAPVIPLRPRATGESLPSAAAPRLTSV